jgi:hypothetical protein
MVTLIETMLRLRDRCSINSWALAGGTLVVQIRLPRETSAAAIRAISPSVISTAAIAARTSQSLWRMVAPENEPPLSEIFIMGECIAPTRERAPEVVRTCKQFPLHFGYPGRLSTAGNIAFPLTPPEVSLGPAYQFSIYHLLHVDAGALFPVEIETVS